ncbi:MAG TPA: DUF1648 domain-containing protein [Bacteroidetes bacterium]|nr:DUF1648 domain-containing protein [Bacteroidota bacterium]
MKINWRNEWLQWVLLAGMFLLAALSWHSAPERIPVHWNIAGEVDRYGGRFEGLFAIPLLSLAIYLLMLFVPRIDPAKLSHLQHASVYSAIRLAILSFLVVIYLVVHLAMRGVPVRIEVIVPLLVGVLFLLLGNWMGKIRPNWFLGIRTPWTLSSRRSWQKTHRVGGWIFIFFGFAFMGMALFSPIKELTPFLFMLLPLGLVWLVAYSYLEWKRDPERKTTPGAAN